MSIRHRLPTRLAAASLMALVLAAPAGAAAAAPRHADARREAALERVAERRAAIAARVVVAGTLVDVDVEARTVTVAVDGGRPLDLVGTTQTFALTPDALVAKDEAVAGLEAFVPGDRIVVSGTVTAEGVIAERAHAHTPEPEVQPEPEPQPEPDPDTPAEDDTV